jgi:MFS transporter, CP family, cyanate transporter
LIRRPGPRGVSGGLWFVAILLVAANLRPVIASVPPLAEQLAAALHLSSVATGVLTTLPVLCMAVFAPVASPAAARFGEQAVLIASIALICTGAGLRAVHGTVFLYAATAVAGIGIAVAGTLLPALVRTRTPGRVGPVTGLYSAVLITGALLASGVTEPVRAVLHTSAQSVLAIWAVPAAVALVVWSGVPVLAPSTVDRAAVDRAAVDGAAVDGAAVDGAGGARLPWRSDAAWRAALFMGAQSLLFYATLAWLPARYTDLGVSASAAGLLLALFSAAQIVTALAMPSLAHRSRTPAIWIAASVGLTTLGLLLIGLVPLGAPWAWVVVVGLGMGGNLALALTVITQIAPDPRAATAYAGMAFLVGYLLAAVGPVSAGALRDATGSLTAVFLTLAALGAVTLGLGLTASRR